MKVIAGDVYCIIDNDICKLFRVYKIILNALNNNIVYVQKIKYIKHDDDMYYVGSDVLSLSILEKYLTKINRKVWYKIVRKINKICRKK